MPEASNRNNKCKEYRFEGKWGLIIKQITLWMDIMTTKGVLPVMRVFFKGPVCKIYTALVIPMLQNLNRECVSVLKWPGNAVELRINVFQDLQSPNNQMAEQDAFRMNVALPCFYGNHEGTQQTNRVVQI